MASKAVSLQGSDRKSSPVQVGVPTGRATMVRPVRRRRNLRKTLELVVLIGPALVLFVGFVLVPIGIAARYSLYNWSGLGPLSDFIGLHNYRVALTDPVFRGAIEHNLILAGLSVVIQLPLSLSHWRSCSTGSCADKLSCGWSLLRLTSCRKPRQPSSGFSCSNQAVLSTKS